MGKKRDLEIVKKFKKEIVKKISINKVLFFGSRANGKPKKESDFDLIVVGKNFKEMDNSEKAKLYFSWQVDYPVDFLCYTPEQFEKLKDKLIILKEAVRTGIEI